MDLARTLAKDWGPGDEVVVTRLDHDSNVRSWVLAAEAVGATVRWVDFDPATGELEPAQVEAGAQRPDQAGRRAPAPPTCSARCPTSGRSPTSRTPPARRPTSTASTSCRTRSVDVAALGADFLACSPYKFLGPHCGVLAAGPATLEPLRPDKLVPASDDVPERFELGTLPYELLAGTTAAVDFLADLASDDLPPGASRRERLVASMTALAAHEDRLRERVEARPRRPARRHRAGRAPDDVRRPCWPPSSTTTCRTYDGTWPRATSTRPAGSFYAYEAVAPARPGHGRRPADRARALHRRRGRRPPARRARGRPGRLTATRRRAPPRST